jgi:hypothetical protein
MTSEFIELPRLGWREWLALPDLNIPLIKVKIDTGARTSALHAFFIDPYKKGGEHWIMFAIHPDQHHTDVVIECHAPVKDLRMVTDSGGHKSRRYVVETNLVLGSNIIRAELTLTNRDNMKFRMLLGRTAMRGKFIIAPEASYLQGKPNHALFSIEKTNG